jgi:hypothetical protein
VIASLVIEISTVAVAAYGFSTLFHSMGAMVKGDLFTNGKRQYLCLSSLPPISPSIPSLCERESVEIVALLFPTASAWLLLREVN